MTKARTGLLTLFVAAVASAAQAQDARPRYLMSGSQVAALSNLYTDPACTRASVRGRVAKRDFDDVGLVLVSVVVENRSGARTLVNIDKFTIDHASETDKEWLLKGLQTILTVGREIEAGTLLCGAAGRVAILASVRPADR